MIQAVIFDLDGLLVDSEPVWQQARGELFSEYAVEWNDSDQQAMMGVSTKVWSEYMSEKLGGRLSPQEVVRWMLDRMEEHYHAGDVEILPGATEAISKCASLYDVGLASGSPLCLIDAALSGAGWKQYFSWIVSSDEVENGKPAPDVYLEICSRMEVDAERAVVLEDSGAGIQAAKAAGMKVIAVPNRMIRPKEEALDKADVQIATLEEIESALKRLD